jgi:hypothetical protein
MRADGHPELSQTASLALFHGAIRILREYPEHPYTTGYLREQMLSRSPGGWARSHGLFFERDLTAALWRHQHQVSGGVLYRAIGGRWRWQESPEVARQRRHHHGLQSRGPEGGERER